MLNRRLQPLKHNDDHPYHPIIGGLYPPGVYMLKNVMKGRLFELGFDQTNKRVFI